LSASWRFMGVRRPGTLNLNVAPAFTAARRR
jgi:hypothetical protein